VIGTPPTEVRLTRAQQDYLKALYLLRGDDRPVPTRDLAQRLGISSPSVSEMVTRLTAQGLVEHDRYRGQQLTGEGRRVALELVRHHRLLEMFLVRVLGFGWDEVHDEAERLEHVISERMEARIYDALGRPQLDPHGDPIPSLAGDLAAPRYRSLLEVGKNERVTIRRVSDREPGKLRALEALGLALGEQVQVLRESVYEGPLTVGVGRRRRQLPIGLARVVFVE
jgi:DtxR family Mn-dependent transcriptional regulator